MSNEVRQLAIDLVREALDDIPSTLLDTVGVSEYLTYDKEIEATEELIQFVREEVRLILRELTDILSDLNDSIHTETTTNKEETHGRSGY